MAAIARLIIVAAACASAVAQYEEERSPRYIASESKPAPAPPVAILKQINRHNEDGSYTYGYEAGDGSFKIETKSPSGEVKGKYGYKDDTGKVRVIEYGANKYGFQPAGEGITVAPPTLVDETREEEQRQQQRLNKQQQQGGRSQYRQPASPQQQSLDYDYEEPVPAPRPAYRPAPQPAYRAPAPAPAYQAPVVAQAAPAPRPPKPIFVAGAAPAPAPVEDNSNFFSPAPRQQPYRAPKQNFPSFQQAQTFPAQTQIEYTQNFPSNPSPPQPRYTATPSHFSPQPQNPPFSMLDQLLKEYALPQGGAAPLHDITFGSF